MSISTVSAENSDIETQPLLSHPNNSRYNGKKQRKGYRWYINRLKHHFLPYLVGFFLFSIIFVLVFLFYTRENFDHLIPSNQAIQSNFLEITELEIDQISINGWKSIKNDPQNKNSLPNGKYLQLSCNFQTYLNYDLMNQSSVPLTPQQASWFKYINEKGIRTMCISMNNVTTFNRERDMDSQKDIDFQLGSLFILEPICLDLHNGTINYLNLTLLIKPEIKNLVKILKKIWDHDYFDLKLWSIFDISLSKQILFVDQPITFWKLHNLIINWDKILNWNKLFKMVKFFRDNFREDIVFENIEMVDSVEGFHIQLNIKQKLTNKWTDFLEEKLHWFHIPFNDSTINIPSLEWYVRLPDCYNSFTIELTNVTSYTDNYNISKDLLSMRMNIDMIGKLPDVLLGELCSTYDEANLITPLTKILNHLFNETEPIQFQICGRVKNSDIGQLPNSLIPYDILDDILNGLSYVEMKQNITYNVSESIKDVSIDDMQLLWKNNKLSIVGTVIGFIDLSFYQTNLERFQINKIKGNLELYHNGNHFISLPMKHWISASSQIIHETNNKNTNKYTTDKISTVLKIQFDVNDDDMEILNNFELSKCLNEIIFKGETSIEFESVLDINIESLLGDIVLLGLTTSGSTIVF